MKTLFATAASIAALAAGVAFAQTDMETGMMDFDTDADGIATMDEFDEGLGTSGLYTSLDANQDGVLTEDEYGDYSDDFAGYDADASGDLTEDEFNRGIFGAYDLDASGDLDDTELQTADADFAEGGRYYVDSDDVIDTDS
ncbi:hypothetical protein BCF33_0139 [Hasllibacter halocynthiae]|uniref:EF-hand domain-containing protein n=1 Tax=Hasllibacter halocynthiae TaxID=595589 RepID=A0A2T0X6H5_9RHOB|nr:hypothetical protein [Hasllibacter halocynthiae]PRY94548.1 hypothetical protein BCF33_0139 [Hasllibacter halocynthiae]